jgi:peroxiredoxin
LRIALALAAIAAGIVLAVLIATDLGISGGPTAAPSATPRPTAVASMAEPSATRGATMPSTPAASPSTPSPTPSLEVGVDVGQLAPDFELLTPEGEPMRLSHLRGRPVWLNFWAPWCPACRTEMPRLERFYLHREEEDGLVILGVGVQDTPEAMRAYADEVGVTYPIVVDGDSVVANQYRALALPVHYWIDRDGVVSDWAFGELPPEELARMLEKILAPSKPSP